MSRKRLLLINSRFLPLIGGGETYTLELMSNFVDHGWEVHLATHNNGYGQAEWHGCHIHYIDGFDDDCLRPSECAPRLRHVLDEVQPDIVHIHNVMPFFIYSSIVEPDEFPAALTIHNTPDIPRRLFGTFKDYESERIFVRQLLANGKYQKLIVGSKYYLDSYSEVAPWITEKSKAEVVYFFPPQLTRGLFTEHKRESKNSAKLLFPSRIIKRKGIENVIEALSRLPNDFTLLLPSFGTDERRDREYKQHVGSLMDKLGVRSRVEIPDKPVPPEKMSEYYRKADIVIMPSYYEGFGIAAVEAMSWGVPVVVSDVGGLREIITDQVNGLLIPPNDTPALQEAILQLTDNTTLYDTVADNAIKTVQERFSRDSHIQRMEQIYEEVLGR